MNKDKYQYIQDNINYILGPYYVVNQKSGVVTIDYRKLRKIPNNVLKLISDFLINDSKELYTLIDKIKHDDLNKVYLGLSKIEGIVSNRDKCYINLLNQVKKYLNKTNNQDGLQILLEYYNTESYDGI